MKIYVGNLNFKTTSEQLHDLFSQHGEVVDATVINDRETGRSRGFGFVEMKDESAAKEAIDALDGQEFDGRTLRVNESQPRERGSGGGGGRGGGRREGGGGRGGW